MSGTGPVENGRSALADAKARLGPLGWGTAVVFVLTQCANLVNFVVKFYLGHKLTPLDFGALDPVVSLTLIASLPMTVVTIIASKSISRLLAEGQDAQRRTLTLHLLVLMLTGSLLAAAGVMIFREAVFARLALDPGRYLGSVLWLVILAYWNTGCIAIIRGLRHYRLMVLPQVAAPVAVLAATWLLVGVLGFELQGALLASAAGWTLVLAITLLPVLRDLCRPRAPYPDEFSLIMQSLVPAALHVTALTVLLNFDRLLVRNFLTADSGGFGAVVTLGAFPLLLIGPVLFVTLPLAAAEHASGDDRRRFYVPSLCLSLGVTAVLALFFLYAAGPVFRLWNPGFVPYAAYVPLYAVSLGLHGVIMFVCNAEFARSDFRFLWVVLPVTLCGCGALYLAKGCLDLYLVIGGLLVTRILMLAGLGIIGLRNRGSRPPRDPLQAEVQEKD